MTSHRYVIKATLGEKWAQFAAIAPSLQDAVTMLQTTFELVDYEFTLLDEGPMVFPVVQTGGNVIAIHRDTTTDFVSHPL